MNRHRIPFSKINTIRQMCFTEGFHRKDAAKELNISLNTVNKYVREFQKIKECYPKKLSDKTFFMPVEVAEHRPTEQYVELLEVIPKLLNDVRGQKLTAIIMYPRYKALCPEGYSFGAFQHNFFQWCEDNGISRQRAYSFPKEDIATLSRWRCGNDHQKWQIAVALLESGERKFVSAIAAKVEACKETVLRWLRIYERDGLAGLERTHTIHPKKLDAIKTRQDELIHLLHQSPKLHGYNRTSWRLTDLAECYTKHHGGSITITQVSRDLKKRGYRSIKAKEVLTSPDPLFKEKYAAIQEILKNLTPQEKFFSIDEYGPFSVKMKGGRSFVKKGEYRSYPQRQKSKGWLICTAALELSTNQVTHFYSLKKNTGEMIKLLDVLVREYDDQDKIYLSWDAASWHASKELNEYVDMLNSDLYRSNHHNPLVPLAPLPSCAQFLNVIESVFSGLARAVIHNSDYQSVDECKGAIDRHFSERNAHFKAHPHKAGNRIWGQEREAPVFDKANRCKTTSSLSNRNLDT